MKKMKEEMEKMQKLIIDGKNAFPSFLGHSSK